MNESQSTVPLALVNFPTQMSSVKVVQLFVDEQPTMVCGPDQDYHAHILRVFLEEAQLPYDIAGTNHRGILKPALAGERHRVVGMGDSVIFPSFKKMFLTSGGSVDYALPVSLHFNDLIRQTLPSWTLITK